MPATIMKLFLLITLVFFAGLSTAQLGDDSWINEQLQSIKWQKSYRGALADFHPVTLMLASDQKLVAGYLIHEGDQRKHRLIGDWISSRQFILHEQDETGRITGYLSGTVTDDQVEMDWISSDQNRMFPVKASPANLVRIRSFKPVAESIQVTGSSPMNIAVQKLDYGMVSGTVNNSGYYTRFEGYCLDGTCSIWNTVFQSPSGVPIKVQMRQRDDRSYRVTLNGVEHQGTIKSVTPLVLKRYDNSAGFLDFNYPAFNSKGLEPWINKWLSKLWDSGVKHLEDLNAPESGARLVHRSSGWVEILDESENFVSGMLTFINPGAVHREAFIWLKKEDTFLSQADFINTPEDIKKCGAAALKMASHFEDQDFQQWLQENGHPYMVPVSTGVIMATGFNMVYGDDLRLLRTAEARAALKKKFWKYFGW